MESPTDIPVVEVPDHKAGPSPLASPPEPWRYQDLFDHAPGAYLVLDEAGRVTFASERGAALLGVTGEALLGQALFGFAAPGDQARWREHCRTTCGTVLPAVGELRLLRSDGSAVDVRVESLWTDDGRGRQEMRLFLTDISLQRDAEREIRERRGEMELLVKQQVAAHTASAIAHELNQPLVAISAYCEAAGRALGGGSRSRVKLARAVREAGDQALRASRTLSELMEFLHRGDAPQEGVDLNAVVRDAIATVTESGYGGFTPIIDLASPLEKVRANRLQLQKVLVNLLHNGVQAMMEAGVPKAAITITVRTAAEANLAQVTVKDTGPGLSPLASQRLFEPFFTTKPRGIGLGLAISRAIIESHGGQLWADRSAEGGAVFHFTLPFMP